MLSLFTTVSPRKHLPNMSGSTEACIYLQKAGLGFEPSPVKVASCITCARLWIGLPCARMENIYTVWTFPRAGDRAGALLAFDFTQIIVGG